MPSARVPLGNPSPDVQLACGSMSTTRTRWPAWAIEAARFTVVVVLPTPPFWFAIARIRFIRFAHEERGPTGPAKPPIYSARFRRSFVAFLSQEPVDTLFFEEKICAQIR